MTRMSRDRITVDLRGLRAALFEQARVHGVRPSDFVRSSLASALTVPEGAPSRPRALVDKTSGERVRLTLRMTRADAAATIRAARRSGLPPGDFVAELIAGIPVHTTGGRPEHLSQLAASSAELSTLSRNIHHLARLLREGSSRAAMEYRDMLNTLASEVREHLLLAGGVLDRSKPRTTREGAKEL
jgi:hypothetical protein